MTKQCSKCRETKCTTEFNKQASSKDGFHNYCRVCSKSAFKGYIPPTKIVVPEDHKYCKTCKTVHNIEMFVVNADGVDGRYSVCRDCCSTRASEYLARPENRLWKKDYSAAYTKRNRDAANAKSAKRRANRLNRTPKWVDKEYEDLFLKEIHHLAMLRENCTGFKWQVDHTVPFISDSVSGFHCSDNMRLIPAFDNLSKGNRYWPDMWLDSDFRVLDNAATQTQGE